jgi:hypothetical protein
VAAEYYKCSPKMNRIELKQELMEAGFPVDSYSCFSKPKDESLCIEYIAPHWVVFYSERGMQTDRKIFSSEEAACDHFYGELVRWFRRIGDVQSR